MQLTFHGTVGEVTGSCLQVETDQCRFIVDYGLFQASREADEKNRAAYARDPGKLDFVLLTHAHLDHCGLLPRFARERRPPMIHCTRPTADLVPVMLKDSAHIQEHNHDHGLHDHRRNRSGRQRPHAPAGGLGRHRRSLAFAGVRSRIDRARRCVGRRIDL